MTQSNPLIESFVIFFLMRKRIITLFHYLAHSVEASGEDDVRYNIELLSFLRKSTLFGPKDKYKIGRPTRSRGPVR